MARLSLQSYLDSAERCRDRVESWGIETGSRIKKTGVVEQAHGCRKSGKPVDLEDPQL
jgi:hypothetical protein